jgi:LacI family transcriptional regulator
MGALRRIFFEQYGIEYIFTMVRIKDVAKRAQVSTTTVSRVLHSSGYVSPRTRKIVESALEELGYRLDFTAQSLKKQQTFILGHVLRSSSVNTFFAHVLSSVEEAAHHSGFNVISSNVKDDQEGERRAVEVLLSRRVDGVLFTTVLSRQSVDMLRAEHIPVVLVERYFDFENVDRVVADNYAGAFEATSHLISYGHRRIAFIGGPVPSTPELARVELDRRRGYEDALRSAGFPIDERYVGHASAYDVPCGRERTNELLESSPRPTAVFAASDQLALGAFQAAYAHALRVPEDLSLIGFDDTVARFGVKPLTTVRQPMEELGKSAVRLLVERQQGTYEGESRTVILKTRLVLRETTGPAP